MFSFPNCSTFQFGRSMKSDGSGKYSSICSFSHTGTSIFLPAYISRNAISASYAGLPHGKPKMTNSLATRRASDITIARRFPGICSRTSEATTASKEPSSKGSSVAEATTGVIGHFGSPDGNERSQPTNGTLRNVPSPKGPEPISSTDPAERNPCCFRTRRIG